MRARTERPLIELVDSRPPGPAAVPCGPLGAAPLLRLLQLASPALPVGAFAFSQGLESAAAFGWITNESNATSWMTGTLEDGLARLDLPVLARSYTSWADDDVHLAKRWSSFLLASRESRERRLEDLHLGRALARLLTDQGVECAAPFRTGEDATFAGMFALGAVRFGVPLTETLLGFAFSWAEAQVGAAARLIPLGQLCVQRVLASVGQKIPDSVAFAQALSDAELGSCLPGLAIASALHETQYCRLFKS